MPRRIRAREALLLAALAAAAGCAKKGPPSGGPPDLEPPRIVEVTPDSGSAGVARDARIVVTFSEGMEPRGTGEAVDLAPEIPVRQRRWSGRTLTLVLAESLKADRTYTLFVGNGARDRHGNNVADARTIVFTTAPKFPRGRIEGKIQAVGFAAPGTLLWCYRDGRQPDSTAKDYDALGVADAQGEFRIGGLATPARWRVWAFADLNFNRSFEPASDLLVAADTTFELTDSASVATGLRLKVVNPKAPGRFAGSVIDTLGEARGVVRLIVSSLADTSRRVLYEVPGNNNFDFKWDPGAYRVRAYRDVDRNRSWKRDEEPASPEITVSIQPGGEVIGAVFVLFRPAPIPAAEP